MSKCSVCGRVYRRMRIKKDKNRLESRVESLDRHYKKWHNYETKILA